MLLITSLGYAEEKIDSTKLIGNAKEYDGKIIIYEGEVIGDIMLRGKYAWINVNDGKGTIGVWVDRD
ncbi:MAG: DNA-binding protein, partial [Candidatus Omnitrophica bacterium]|nr:DNA-binding protein [Candidatus Omnitrophota bacterium]